MPAGRGDRVGRGDAAWRTGEVWAISGSAFFADLGYQAVIAALPLLLVLRLHASVTTYGLATALGYGGGAIWGLLGGRLADRYGRRRVAIIGNSGILVLAGIGLSVAAWQVVVLFTVGWWARNSRSPARRALLVGVTSPGDRGRAFGFLHALDVGGGMLSALGAAGLLAVGIGLRGICLLTAAPLVVSTLVLLRVHEQRPGQTSPRPSDPGRSGSGVVEPGSASPGAPDSPAADGMLVSTAQARTRAVRAVLVATALYGFSFYSLGFPVLTVAKRAHSDVAGVATYALFLGCSAIAGYTTGSRRWRALPALATGYAVAAAAAVALGAGAQAGILAVAVVAVGALGLATGLVETVEPVLIAALRPLAVQGRAQGALTAARSLGLFVGNLALGLLYVHGPLVAYAYAAGVAGLAAILLTAVGLRLRLGVRIGG